jgi:hypothetical protein
MTGKFLVRSCIALVSIVLFTLITLIPGKHSLRAGVPSKANDQEKTVEQVKKNIQVLKGLPASQLSMVMDYMATSLGVRCDHCHVIDTTGWYMDKDDKPTKRTARKMLQMVMDLNAKNFGGRNEVSCYTCHRGSSEPAKLIPLPQPPAKATQEEAEVAPSLPSFEQELAMYENALGGTDALKKITSRVMKGVSVDAQGREMPLEIVQQSPDKYAATVSMREGMTSTRAFNGTSGWMSSPRGARELPPEASEELKHEAQLFPLARIQELSKTMHVSDKDTVNGTTAYILSAPAGEHATERYYIDAATGLLLRKSTVTETMIGNIPEQIDYSDYRAVDGVKVPFTIRISAVDPRDCSTQRFSSIEQNVPIDEKKFEMPKGKK